MKNFMKMFVLIMKKSQSISLPFGSFELKKKTFSNLFSSRSRANDDDGREIREKFAK